MSKRVWLFALGGVASSGALSCSDDPALIPGGGGVTGGTVVAGAATTAGSTSIAGTLPFEADPKETVEDFDFGAACDDSRHVTAFEPALIVRDPEVLEPFSLERVLTQIIASAGAELTPLELLQRLFDTENTVAEGVFADNPHCDSTDNPAFQVEPATYCPRAEGRLARSEGLLTPGHADFFEPVALVNRFDLLPSDAATCGEYHLVFAKRSGRTDPQDRVLLSFDARLLNGSHRFSSCRPVVEVWAGLEALDAPGQRDALVQIFFNGIAKLPPIITASSLGASDSQCQHVGRCGQVRVAQGMQEPFEFRQFRAIALPRAAQSTQLWFNPSSNSHSLPPAFFDLAPQNTIGAAFRHSWRSSVTELVMTDLNRLSFFSDSTVEAGETAVTGPASPNYRARLIAGTEAQITEFDDQLLPALAAVSEACPAEDPLSPLALVERTAALSCAGCHAPNHVLSDGRQLGCGEVWPESLGVNHIDESGELSPALRDVFLPYRARVLTTFSQACDGAAALTQVIGVPPLRLQ